MRGTIKGKAQNPNKIEYELTITLPIEDWCVLLDQMVKMEGNSSYPAWHVIDGIRDVVNHSTCHYAKTLESE